MSRICVDAGFLIALCDESDSEHNHAIQHLQEYFQQTRNELLAPWPILYEVVSTRLMRHRARIMRLRRHWRSFELQNRLRLVDDNAFRRAALDQCFTEVDRNSARLRGLSLVDRVIRGVLAEDTHRIDYFITFNRRDFEDVCQRHRIRLIGSASSE